MPIQGKNTIIDEYEIAAKRLQPLLTQLVKDTKTLGTTLSKVSGAKNMKELNTAVSQTNESQKRYVKTVEQAIRVEDELTKKTNKQKDADYLLAKAKIQKREETRKLNEKIKEELNLTKKTTSFTKKMSQSFQGAIIKVGLMYAGLKTLIRGLGNLIKISSDFEKQMDKVQAITGANAETMDRLKKSAQDLGSKTTKTATEVGQLQEELSKLGFTSAEILSGTGGILALSEATGSDLAQSAKVAGATIRGFGLDAAESTRVVDVMTKSFSSSALDLSKFETAMAQVAPVAKATNTTIEQSTAYLSALVDSGLDASSAGTALRNIMLENAKSGRSFNDSMSLLNNSTDKSATAMELFGKRGAVAAIVLSDNIEKTAELTKTYEDASGTAEEMARIMRDNLAGDITIAKSAWEGLVLSIDNGSGSISTSLRFIVKNFTDVITAIRRLGMSDEELALELSMERANKEVEKFKANISEKATKKDWIEIINNEIEYQNELIKEQQQLQLLNINLSKLDMFRSKKYKDENLQLEGFIALAENQIILLENLKATKTAAAEKEIEDQQKVVLFNTEKFIKDRDFEKLRTMDIKGREKLQKKLTDQIIDEELAILETKMNADNDEIDSEIEKNQKLAEEREKAFKAFKEDVKRKIDLTTNFSEQVGSILGQAIVEGEVALKEAGKQILLLTLKTLKGILQQQVIASITNATVQSFAQPDSVATLGITGAIRAGILVGLIEAAYAGVEALLTSKVQSFYKGVDNFKGGLAIVGDAPGGKSSTELIKLPNNQNFLVDRPTAIKLPKGTDVVPEKQIQHELANLVNEGRNVVNISGGITENKFENIMNKSVDKMVTAVNNRPQDIFEGMTYKGVKQRDRWKIYKDDRYS